MDLFGVWSAAESWTLDELRVAPLPPAVLDPAAVLETVAELSSDGTIPHHILGTLRRTHGLDMTALSLSSTSLGNAYRQCVLLMRST